MVADIRHGGERSFRTFRVADRYQSAIAAAIVAVIARSVPDDEHEDRQMDVDAMGPQALDFWLGRWSLSWSGHGTGTNTIRRILGDRVVEESFEGQDPSGPLLGRSLSVLDVAEGRWRQTWVDSTGAYLDFVGVELEGAIAFERTGTNGWLQRMRWLDKSPDGFTWHWERSVDHGRSWELLWAITYRRLDAPS